MNDEHAPHLEKQAAADDVPLLEVSELTTYFPITAGLLNRTIANVHAVESVSFGFAVIAAATLEADALLGRPAKSSQICTSIA